MFGVGHAQLKRDGDQKLVDMRLHQSRVFLFIPEIAVNRRQRGPRRPHLVRRHYDLHPERKGGYLVSSGEKKDSNVRGQKNDI